MPRHWPAEWTVDPLWFEDDDFWEAVRPALFVPSRWIEAEVEIVHALALMGVSPPDRILDVACGPGRHLIPLAEFGYRPTGVDRTASFLSEAAALAQARGVQVRTIEADLRSLAGMPRIPDTLPMHGPEDPDGPFDGAIWLDSSIGYSPRASDDIDALGAVRRLLRPGARLVLETLGLECALGRPLSADGAEGAETGTPALEEVEAQTVNGLPWVVQRRITRAGWMDVRWGPADGRPVCYRHRLYRSSDVVDMLHQTEWRNYLIYGDLLGSRYGPAASTLVVVAER